MKKHFIKIISIILICYSFMNVFSYAQVRTRVIRLDLPSGASVSSPTLDTNVDNDDVNIVDLGVFFARRSIISGQIYFDRNRNGVQDPFELGVPDQTIIIRTEVDGDIIVSTDENGVYTAELFSDEIVEIFLELDEGEAEKYDVTTIEKGGTTIQVVSLDEPTLDLPAIGLVEKEVEIEVIDIEPKPIIPVKFVPEPVKQIIKVVRTGGVNNYLIPSAIFVILIFVLYRSIKKKK